MTHISFSIISSCAVCVFYFRCLRHARKQKMYLGAQTAGTGCPNAGAKHWKAVERLRGSSCLGCCQARPRAQVRRHAHECPALASILFYLHIRYVTCHTHHNALGLLSMISIYPVRSFRVGTGKRACLVRREPLFLCCVEFAG